MTKKHPITTKKEQTTRITKKTKLGLKMALSRIDSVANEAHTISDPKIRREVVTYMMDLRYKIHELLDDTIHFERVTLKKKIGFEISSKIPEKMISKNAVDINPGIMPNAAYFEKNSNNKF